MSFALRVTFPAGQFNANGAGGTPEWPPSPARVAAALLASAPSSESVRALYGFTAPIIESGIATQRTGLVTYVSPNPESLPSARTSKFEPWLNKVTKEPQGGTLTDDSVTYYYAEQAPVDLNRAAQAVTYLGRPTSPAIIEVIEDATVSRRTPYRWEPAAAGDLQINVHTPDLLAALDGQHEVRTQMGDPGMNLTYARPRAAYALVTDVVGAPREASIEDALGALESGFYYATSGAQGADVMVAMAVAESLLDSALLPVFTEHERGSGILSGFFALGLEDAPAQLEVPTSNRVLNFRRIDEMADSRVKRLRRYLSSAQTWTTLLPVPTEGLADALIELENTVGAGIVDGAVHPMPRFDLPRRIDDDSVTHLSLRLDAFVKGPVFLTVNGERYPLTPFKLEA